MTFLDTASCFTKDDVFLSLLLPLELEFLLVFLMELYSAAAGVPAFSYLDDFSTEAYCLLSAFSSLFLSDGLDSGYGVAIICFSGPLSFL